MIPGSELFQPRYNRGMSETPLRGKLDDGIPDSLGSSNLPVPRRGAGGTPGGIGTFIFGLILAAAGGYLILNQVTVTGAFGGFWFLGGHGGFGLVMLPFLIGVGLLFASRKSWLGWLFMIGGAAIIGASVLMNMQIYFRSTSLYLTLVMFGMFAAGIGLILRSLRAYPEPAPAPGRD